MDTGIDGLWRACIRNKVKKKIAASLSFPSFYMNGINRFHIN